MDPMGNDPCLLSLVGDTHRKHRWFFTQVVIGIRWVDREGLQACVGSNKNATSQDLTPNGGLVRESFQNPLNSGLGIIVICPDLTNYQAVLSGEFNVLFNHFSDGG